MDEIRQYEEQLEQVRIELKDQPEELKLVEDEVLALINELKKIHNLEDAANNKEDDVKKETKKEEPKEVKNIKKTTETKEDPKQPAKVDEYEVNKSKWKSFTSKRK